jgi:O-antigen/teichoic acid export membrane protein
MGAEQQVVYGVTEPKAKRPGSPGDASAPLQFTAERMRVWGARAAFSLADQGLFSGAGLLVNLLLARWLAPESYGAFAVAFAAFLFTYGFHNALLLEPMSVFGPSRHEESLSSYFRAQLVIHGLMVSPLSAFGIAAGLLLWRITPGSPLIGAIIGVSLALPFILLLWLMRRICYAVQRPAMAATGTALYLAFVAAGLLGVRTASVIGPFTVFVLLGSGGLLASLLLIFKLGLFSPRVDKSLATSWRNVWRENWGYGRWLLGSGLLSSIVTQVQVFVVSALLGLGAAGVLRAMQLPALLIIQVSTATGFLILPAFAYDFSTGAIRRMRQKAIFVAVGISTFALVLGGVTWAFSGPIERALFSGKYASSAWLMPVLVLMTVALGPMQGFGMALRAIRKPKFDLVSGLLAAPIAMLCAYFGTKWWGLAGAAWSFVIGFAIQGVVTTLYFSRLVWIAEMPGEVPASAPDSE